MENDNTILQILQKIPLFQTLNGEDHEEIIKHITLQFFPANYTLFNEGDEGDRLYIMKTGMVKIFHPNDPDNPLAMLGPDEFFGEMALFEEKSRSASAMTTEESEVFLLEKKEFFELVLKNQNIAGTLSEEFLNRIKQNKEKGQ